MKPILTFDDFAADAKEIREAVISGQFSSQMGPDGATYTGISVHPVNHWPKRIAELLGKNIIPKLSCFRLNLAGELPHSWVHSDGICADFATVLYLNEEEQCKGGTAFWEHKELHIDSLPARSELGESADSFYKKMDKDWKDLSLWKQVRMISMKWNRLITYPTSLFHSRYPFSGFGKGPKDGRLIWICFYDIEGSVSL